MTEIITKHFIEQRIEADIEAKKYPNGVITRFPPEPNGYLHIGHAKAICVNFGLAKQYQGRCHLRFDDTNPVKEDIEFMRGIEQDIKWLGFSWDELNHTADYFDQLFDVAIQFINKGFAYVCSLTGEQIKEYRGTLTEAGKNSPFRDRSIAENLDLFQRMKAGEFAAGEHVLRAKIDMSSGNINLRDPIMYRILHQAHPHTGDKWCIYPMYDYAHCFSDAFENITHSLCSLEFQDHRPLYDWFLQQIFPEPRPQQIEFSRLNLSHTITSKRKLRLLVEEKRVNGWDDPRMPTLIGLRRRGFTPTSIKNLVKSQGVSKSDSTIDMGLLEQAARDDLNEHAKRVMCVLNPLKITLINYPDDKVEPLTAANHPQQPEMGERIIPFSKELYIDRDDFMLVPEKKYFRLAPDREVRLRYGYIIKCEEVITHPDTQEIVELRCSVDFDTLGKNPSDRKVKGVIHWVAKHDCQQAEVRLYDRLFNHENPTSADEQTAFLNMLNPNSLTILKNCLIEPSVKNIKPETSLQFERVGFFVADRFDCQESKLVFNRIVSLRDSWNKP